MAVYAIGDLHLSLDGDHSMEVFPGWENYVSRIEENWNRLVRPKDTVVLVGDISWGMTLEHALADFCFLERLPGKKYIVKGNHDYWWTTKAKLEAFFTKHGLKTLDILHNNTVTADGIALCGTRGWMLGAGDAHDEKIILREAMRLRLSLEEGKKTGQEVVAFLHYPPVYGRIEQSSMLDVLKEFQVKHCYYGHIHHKGCQIARQGNHQGVELTLVSADYRNFVPLAVRM